MAAEGVDISRLHGELDRLKSELCRCNHTGECLACRGFEALREQAQMVVAAASQPVLMQVANEAAAKDLVDRLGGMQTQLHEKLAADSRLQELAAEMAQRLQDDLGGPEALEQLMQQFMGGTGPDAVAPEDRPDWRGPKSAGEPPAPEAEK
jgi:hypothetical protein